MPYSPSMELDRDPLDGPASNLDASTDPSGGQVINPQSKISAPRYQVPPLRGGTLAPLRPQFTSSQTSGPYQAEFSSSRTSTTPKSSPSTSRVAVVIGSSPARRMFLKRPDDELADDRDELQSTGSNSDPHFQPAQRAVITTPTKATALHKSSPTAAATTVAAAAGVGAPTGSLPPQQQQATPVRRRGRPVGWRAGMGPYSARPSRHGARGQTQPPVGETKPRGKPGRPRKQVPGPRAIYNKLTPKFVVFYCEWEGCRAELQNFETLRRHMVITHGKSEACKWGKCAAKGDAAPKFTTLATFEKHMDKAHLESFVWHVGDGPRNDTDGRARAAEKISLGKDAPLPDYLFDKDGIQVTPSIKNQAVETEEERRERRRKLHRLIAERERNAPEDDELTLAELAEMERMAATKQRW